MNATTENQSSSAENNSSKNNLLSIALVIAIIIILALLFMLFRPQKDEPETIQPAPTVLMETDVESEDLEEEDEPEEVVNEPETQEQVEVLAATDEDEELVPDLSISEYSFSQDPRQNEEFMVLIEIRNSGNMDVEDFHWEWWASTYDKACGDEISELEAGDILTVECIYTYTSVGTYTTKVVVDPEDDIDESDEDNNEVTEKIVPIEQEKADLEITEYSFDPTPERAESFTISITINNKGEGDAGEFWWEWLPNTEYSYACREQLDGLDAGDDVTVTCNYMYGSGGTYPTKAIADADDDIEETDETNNEYTENIDITP